MKQLLTAIKTELTNGLPGIRPGDVFITNSLELIPNDVRPPAVGIRTDRHPQRKASGMWQVALTVRIAVFALVPKPEASVMGDAATGLKGVLELAAAVHTLLDQNLLGISGMQSAFSPAEGESEPVGDEGNVPAQGHHLSVRKRRMTMSVLN
jgi:hypothetical protein